MSFLTIKECLKNRILSFTFRFCIIFHVFKKILIIQKKNENKNRMCWLVFYDQIFLFFVNLAKQSWFFFRFVSFQKFIFYTTYNQKSPKVGIDSNFVKLAYKLLKKIPSHIRLVVNCEKALEKLLQSLIFSFIKKCI